MNVVGPVQLMSASHDTGVAPANVGSFSSGRRRNGAAESANQSVVSEGAVDPAPLRETASA